MTEALLTALSQNGPFAVLLALAIWFIWRLLTRNDSIQDKRIDEAKDMADVVKNNTISQDANTAALKALADLIRSQSGGRS